MQICRGKIDVGNNALQVRMSNPWLHIIITWGNFVCSFVFNAKAQVYSQRFAFNYYKVCLRHQYFFESLILKCRPVLKATIGKGYISLKYTFINNVFMSQRF